MTLSSIVSNTSRKWKEELNRRRANRPAVARVRLTPYVSVWLPGDLKESPIAHANEFLASLETFLQYAGVTVMRYAGAQHEISVGARSAVVIAMTLSVGTSAEAIEFAHADPPLDSLVVFMPTEFRHGYVCKAMERLQVQSRFFEFGDVAEMRSVLALRVVDAIESQISRLAQDVRLEARDQRKSVPATILFIDLRGISDRDLVRYAHSALTVLNQVIWRATRNERGVTVHSAICGAIIVVQDGHVNIRKMVDEIVSDAGFQGLAVRMGITHGDVEQIADIDKRFNYVGPVINRAARIVFAPENPGVYVEESYSRHASEHLSEVALGPSTMVRGKRDETFPCQQYPSTVLSLLDSSLLACNDEEGAVDAFFLAYDLPRFSDGDRWLLARRSTEVVAEAWQSLTADIPQFYFSPGGDGGVIVIPAGGASGNLTKESAYQKAVEFHEALVRRSQYLQPGAEVTCRIGVHYGQVRLYNAGLVTRPAGAHLFAADILANDTIARAVHGVVISEAIAEALEGGSRAAFAKKFRELQSAQTPAGEVRRYVRAG